MRGATTTLHDRIQTRIAPRRDRRPDARSHALLDNRAAALLAEDAKLALLATVNARALPHLTLITSIQSKSPAQLMFGQFCEGLSKSHVRSNPRVGFLALDRDRHWIRGKAMWSGCAKQGADYELYNRKPLFRYNAYFGIHTVHYLDLVEVDWQRRLSTGPLVAGALQVRAAARTAGAGTGEEALSPWARALLAQPSSLKFVAWVDDDGYPVILPGIAATTRGGDRVVMRPTQDRATLVRPPDGADVALFAIDLEMRSVLLQGRLGGRGTTIDVDWVYNSMPPKHGQVYPPVELRAASFR